MIVVWLIGAVAGFVAMVLAARRSAAAAIAIAHTTRVPPLLVGMTLLAIGTDLPEIANSIISSAAGHGDLNVGDSFGSAAAQVTLILGLLPILARPMPSQPRSVQWLGGVTVVALVAAAVLVADGHLGRLDAVILMGMWLAGTMLVVRTGALELPTSRPHPHENVSRRLLAGYAVGSLIGVGLGASLAVVSIVQIAHILDVPEFVVSFFGASIGTSMPELAVNVSALRRGEPAMAIGGIFGASFLDSTLSVATGPLFFPVAVTAHLAVRGALTALIAVAIATLVVSRAALHDRRSGITLIALYVAFYLAFI